MDGLAKHKEQMIKELNALGIKDLKVLEAISAVPREKFVLSAHQAQAYDNQPLPIQEHQTISQPYIVDLMAQALKLVPNDRILDVGTGSGYAAAVFGKIAKEVYGVEYCQSLTNLAKKRLNCLGYKNISVKQGDGSLGWKKHAPYQEIPVAAGAVEIPKPLLEQLDINGTLVIPLELSAQLQQLMWVKKEINGEYSYSSLGAVAFVPLVTNNEFKLGDYKNPD